MRPSGPLLEVLVAPAGADRAGHDALGERRRRDHVQPLRAHAGRVVRHELRQRAVGRDDDALRVHGARRPRGRRSRRCALRRAARDRAALEDAHAARLDRARERAHPARRVHRRVGRREDADAAGPAHDRAADRPRRPTRPGGRRRASPRTGARACSTSSGSQVTRRQPTCAKCSRGADLLGDLVDALLGGERGAVDAHRDVVPEQADGVLVRRRGAGDEEAAVAAARPARGRARLDDRALDAALGQVPGAREAGDARADHEHVGLVIALERRALLVGIVVPEREQRGSPRRIVGRKERREARA